MRTRDGAVGFEGEEDMEKIPHQTFFSQQRKLKTYHFNVGDLGQVKISALSSFDRRTCVAWSTSAPLEFKRLY